MGSTNSLEINLYEDGVLKMVLRAKEGKLIQERSIPGFDITIKAGHVMVTSDTGYELIWDLKTYIGIEITSKDANVDGLCGNNDQKAENDDKVIGNLPSLIKNVV